MKSKVKFINIILQAMPQDKKVQKIYINLNKINKIYNKIMLLHLKELRKFKSLIVNLLSQNKNSLKKL